MPSISANLTVGLGDFASQGFNVYTGSPARAYQDGALHIPGMTDVVFPETSYITAEALVDAALSGLDRNKLVTVPTRKKAPHWTKWRCSKGSSSGSVISGKIADRYLSDG